jgi:hypothetical protein
MDQQLRGWWARKTKGKTAKFTTLDVLSLLEAMDKSEEILVRLHLLSYQNF